MCYTGLMAQSVCVIVSAVDRDRLKAIVADRNQRQKYVERARIVLASADRGPAQRIAQGIGLSRPTVWRWRQRFAEAGVEGLLRDKPRKPGKAPIAADKAAQLVALTCTEPPHQATHLDRPGDGQGDGALGELGAAHLAGAQTAAAPAADLQAVARSPLQGQAHRHRRPLPRSAGACRGALARREKPDPGTRPHPTRTADQARALPDHDA